MTEKYQVLRLTLSDGRVLKATMPMLDSMAEEPKLSVIKVEIIGPFDLPADCHWEEV